MKLTPTRSFVFCCCCGALFAFILISPSYTRYTDYNGGYGNNNNGNSGGGGYNNGGNGRNGNGPRGGGGMGKGILHILPMHIYMQHLVYISKKKHKKRIVIPKNILNATDFIFSFVFFLRLAEPNSLQFSARLFFKIDMTTFCVLHKKKITTTKRTHTIYTSNPKRQILGSRTTTCR